MKKTFSKKLSLNKSTVANLNTASMGNVKGGQTGAGGACPVLDDDPNRTETCNTCVTCETCLTCVTCNTNCGQNTCQFTCDDLISGWFPSGHDKQTTAGGIGFSPAVYWVSVSTSSSYSFIFTRFRFYLQFLRRYCTIYNKVKKLKK